MTDGSSELGGLCEVSLILFNLIRDLPTLKNIGLIVKKPRGLTATTLIYDAFKVSFTAG